MYASYKCKVANVKISYALREEMKKLFFFFCPVYDILRLYCKTALYRKVYHVLCL